MSEHFRESFAALDACASSRTDFRRSEQHPYRPGFAANGGTRYIESRHALHESRGGRSEQIRERVAASGRIAPDQGERIAPLFELDRAHSAGCQCHAERVRDILGRGVVAGIEHRQGVRFERLAQRGSHGIGRSACVNHELFEPRSGHGDETSLVASFDAAARQIGDKSTSKIHSANGHDAER